MTALTLTLVLLSATDAGGAVLSSTVRRLAEGACLRVACDLSGGMPLEVLHFEHPLPYVSLETRRRASVSTQPVFECMCARLHVDLASTLSTGSFGWSSIPKNRHWSHCARSARWAATRAAMVLANQEAAAVSWQGSASFPLSTTCCDWRMDRR